MGYRVLQGVDMKLRCYVFPDFDSGSVVLLINQIIFFIVVTLRPGTKIPEEIRKKHTFHVLKAAAIAAQLLFR